ncbi:MAG TPA: hypothetical protein VGS10_21115 [Terracidiphilus sp.]|nr:hypothetical protein [Terracidiphilus sp.]
MKTPKFEVVPLADVFAKMGSDAGEMAGIDSTNKGKSQGLPIGNADRAPRPEKTLGRAHHLRVRAGKEANRG